MTRRGRPEIGLINQAVEHDALDGATTDMAQTLASKMNGVLAIGKQAFYDQAQMGLAQAYAHTGEVITTNIMMRDTEEGIAAFLEKRAPNW